MNALEPEPERKGRFRRMAMGIGVVLGIGGGVVFAADQITPARKMLSEVVNVAVVDDTPPPKPPEAPKPPPPPTKPPPEVKSKVKPQPAQQAVENPTKPTDNPPPEPVGLDADSFGSGSGGPAFAVGTSQMGVPGEAARAGSEPPKPKKPKFVEAAPLAGNPHPEYTTRARKLGIEGLMVVEADVDARGKVTRAVVRGKLDPTLDDEAQKTVLGWRFTPATLDGAPVASTKFLRLRFILQ
jgi:periplasmic protein TonB